MTIKQKRLIVIALILIPVVLAAGRYGLAWSYSLALDAHQNKNYSVALPIVYTRALLDDASACGLLGTMYLFGQGVEKNGGRAEYWLLKAANQESVEAQSILGLMYATGQGVARDRAKAEAWLTKAASAGDAQAQSLLKQLYRGQAI